MVTHLGVTNAATDGLEAARALKELNWSGTTHVIISCHLAQADCSQFDSDIGALLSLRTDGLPTDAALQKRAMTAAALKQRVISTDINRDFFFNFARINAENMEDQLELYLHSFFGPNTTQSHGASHQLSLVIR